jgi:hypothetical protein
MNVLLSLVGIFLYHKFTTTVGIIILDIAISKHIMVVETLLFGNHAGSLGCGNVLICNHFRTTKGHKTPNIKEFVSVAITNNVRM